ncbi:hypothetical protein [Streptomyces erythrochromogenes]|uniref:hypothetical protein n=1 Tax=Streptomyces erythrochromogenes TaxID=285574 RepID=UPI00386A167D
MLGIQVRTFDARTIQQGRRRRVDLGQQAVQPVRGMALAASAMIHAFLASVLATPG